MRRILILVAAAIGAWYVLSRRRRARVQDSWQGSAPSGINTGQSGPSGTPASEPATTFDRVSPESAANIQESTEGPSPLAWPETDVPTPPPTVRETVQVELADVSDQVETIRDQAQVPVDPSSAEVESGPDADSMEQPTADGGTAEQGAVAPAAVIETVQFENVDVPEQPVSINEEAQASVEPTSAQAGPAPLSDTAEQAAATPDRNTTEHVASTPDAAAETGPADTETVPEGERPRPIAGEGTTTATGDRVNPLSRAADGDTSTGVAEPLPQGLQPGEPGTGGPAGSSRAPSTPDSTETPTTGMEHAPTVDREEVLERTSGNFVGNKKTRVYHAAGSGNLPSQVNRIYFETEEEAAAAGFRPSARE